MHVDFWDTSVQHALYWYTDHYSTPAISTQISNLHCHIKCAINQSVRFSTLPGITKTRIVKYIENFTTKNENFQMKNSGSFHISAQNIYCGNSLEPPLRGGYNSYPQSMFLSRNKRINVYPCKPQIYCIKVGFKGSNLYRRVLEMQLSHTEAARLTVQYQSTEFIYFVRPLNWELISIFRCLAQNDLGLVIQL